MLVPRSEIFWLYISRSYCTNSSNYKIVACKERNMWGIQWLTFSSGFHLIILFELLQQRKLIVSFAYIHSRILFISSANLFKLFSIECHCQLFENRQGLTLYTGPPRGGKGTNDPGPSFDKLKKAPIFWKFITNMFIYLITNHMYRLYTLQYLAPLLCSRRTCLYIVWSSICNQIQLLKFLEQDWSDFIVIVR